jgi:hypothetical protein
MIEAGSANHAGGTITRRVKHGCRGDNQLSASRYHPYRRLSMFNYASICQHFWRLKQSLMRRAHHEPMKLALGSDSTGRF